MKLDENTFKLLVLYMAPPLLVALLFEKLELVILTVFAEAILTAPPLLALLPVKFVLDRIRLPVDEIAPP